MKLDLAILRQPETSEQAAENIRAIDQATRATETELDKLRERRPQILLDGDDAKAARHDTQIGKCERQRDRLTACRIELEETQTALQQREREAEAMPDIEAAKQAELRGQEILREYQQHAEGIRDLMVELDQIHATITTGNQAASDADMDGMEFELPHQRHYVPAIPEVAEYEEVEERLGPVVTVGGVAQTNGRPPETRRVTRKNVIEPGVRAKVAPNLLDPRRDHGIRLPDAFNGDVTVFDAHEARHRKLFEKRR